MDLLTETQMVVPPHSPWLDSLPRKKAKSVEDALASLPTEVSAAGRDLPLVIAAWTWAEPGTAAQLVEGWLATADAEGNLSPGCPVICHLAEEVADAMPESDKWVQRILPKLAQAMEREFDRYDTRGIGLPLWPSAEEALFPADFAPGCFTVDLGVLLSNEASAFCRLAEGHPEMDRAVGVAEGVQRELDDWLKESFWNEEASAFHRQVEDGESVPDLSPSGFFPLAWEGRTEEMVEGVRPRVSECKSSAWPPQSLVLWFALLLHTPHRSVVAQVSRAGLPTGATPSATAAWTVLTAAAESLNSTSGKDSSRAFHWIDMHGPLLSRTLLAGGALLVCLLLGWWIFHRESSSSKDARDLERRARLACEEGRHARAAALYGQAAQRGHAAYFQYRQAGEWMHLERVADAEGIYRALVESESAPPNARLNLALAVLKQGRREEALGLYRSFAAEVESHPELAARAQLAAELVERQIALDRE